MDTLTGRLIDGVWAPITVIGLLLPDPEADPNVSNGSSDMSSNISVLNKGLKCRLLMLR